MKNEDILKMLEDISNYLVRENYQQALDYIEKKKTEIKDGKDPASEYIDNLVEKLK